MKKFGIVLLIIGLIVLIGGNFFYKTANNTVDTGGSMLITTISGHWSNKIPVFIGGVLAALGAVFFFAYYKDNPTSKTYTA